VTTAGDSAGSELRDLYRELILDHARHPRHFGKLTDATHTAEGINPLCGDKLKMYFRISSNGHIDAAQFEGSGCAISVASASLLTDTVIGMTTADALVFFDAVISRLTNKSTTGDESGVNTAIDLGKIRALEGVKEFPARVKCASLAWHALSSALLQDSHAVSTE
jgi:nitrogen fixation NifU-like protein